MFVAFKLEDGLVIDRRKKEAKPGHLPSSYPYIARAFVDKTLRLGRVFEDEPYTHYVIVQQGGVTLELFDLDGELKDHVRLKALEFAAILGSVAVRPEPGKTTGLVISRVGHNRAYPVSKAGPLEGDGRLNYIDGCSDSLIFCPPKAGEPALNHLHIPTEIHQTPHYHPSDRIGVIARGEGVCYDHPDATAAVSRGEDLVGIDLTEKVEVPLRPGMGWLIEEGTVHSFHTHELEPGEQALDVIAFHPETNWGPTDESHPMLDYTLIGKDRAVRGANSDDDYQSGGKASELDGAPTVIRAPGFDPVDAPAK